MIVKMWNFIDLLTIGLLKRRWLTCCRVQELMGFQSWNPIILQPVHSRL